MYAVVDERWVAESGHQRRRRNTLQELPVSGAIMCGMFIVFVILFYVLGERLIILYAYIGGRLVIDGTYRRCSSTCGTTVVTWIGKNKSVHNAFFVSSFGVRFFRCFVIFFSCLGCTCCCCCLRHRSIVLCSGKDYQIVGAAGGESGLVLGREVRLCGVMTHLFIVFSRLVYTTSMWGK